MTRVVIVGAGIIGAACAYHASRIGLDVTVVERDAVAAGTTGSGEGNLLVSDKDAGPELAMALRAGQLWTEFAVEFGAESVELEAKGGVVVANTEAGLAALGDFASVQRAAGVASEPLDPAQLAAAEPRLATGLPGGMFYPADLQVQPMRAAARLLREAGRAGAQLRLGVEVLGLRLEQNRIRAVRTTTGEIGADVVVNAAGTWGGQLSRLFGAAIPVLPRRGFILVTEPLPNLIRHKVYSADYVANVASDNAGLETSSVIEGTRAGTVLIGASRERVGFQTGMSVPVVRRLAADAVALFPFLARVNLMRVYSGFRPYCPDHLPVVGADPRVEGLLHACGHEGAGIGLAPATGELIAELAAGRTTTLDHLPFSPARLIEGPA